MTAEGAIRIQRKRVNRAEYVSKASDAKRVLDIGCLGGNGLLSEAIRRSAADYAGLDLDEGHNNVRADAQNFRLDQKFDLVVAGEIIEHLPNPAGMLESCVNHLVAGGRLIITTPNAFSLLPHITGGFAGSCTE